MTPLFELDRVVQRFGARAALFEVSLAVQAGERILLAGPSGGGKSTLLRLLSGALSPSSGQVLADGKRLSEMSSASLRAHRARLGLVEQGGQLVLTALVHHNVTAGLLASRSWLRCLLDFLFWTDRAQTEETLAKVGLAGRQWDRADALSGGEQQRVAIARALIRSPSIIIADEPTAALDPSTSAKVLALLECAQTLLLCTHSVSDALGLVDRFIGLAAGRIVFDLPANRVDNAVLDALYAGSDERQ